MTASSFSTPGLEGGGGREGEEGGGKKEEGRKGSGELGNVLG